MNLDALIARIEALEAEVAALKAKDDDLPERVMREMASAMEIANRQYVGLINGTAHGRNEFIAPEDNHATR